MVLIAHEQYSRTLTRAFLVSGFLFRPPPLPVLATIGCCCRLCLQLKGRLVKPVAGGPVMMFSLCTPLSDKTFPAPDHMPMPHLMPTSSDMQVMRPLQAA